MTLAAAELHAAKLQLVPSVVTLLREARERGAADPRLSVQLMFGDADKRVRLNSRLAIPEGYLGADDWNQIVDVAMLQL